jgi:hypothetical protein
LFVLVEKIKKWRNSKLLVIPEFRSITGEQQQQQQQQQRNSEFDFLANNSSSNEAQTNSSIELYDHVAVGGTFDHLHAGHKLLLSASVAVAKQKLTIGLTGMCKGVFDFV